MSQAAHAERLALRGLAGAVRVLRDRRGMPHVVAEKRADAYFGLGFAMATDRLWQMDLMRRLGGGRVAEVLGRPFLGTDVIVRSLGLPAAAARAAAALTGEAAEVAQAFAAGVTARITSLAPAPEFELLGYAPEPWRPADCTAIEYFVGFALALESLEPKLVLARALGLLGAERGVWLYPCPLAAEALDAERLAAYRTLDTELLAPFAALGAPPAGGSNAWAVAPRRAAGGAALLAGDPHLLHTAPTPWYAAHLQAPDLDVAGAAYVGGPVVQVGRNGRGAWSVTNLTADDADLVVERVETAGGERYALEGTWEPLVHDRIAIAVRGEEPLMLDVRRTRNGPLLDGTPGDPPAGGTRVALKWKGTEAPGQSITAWLAMHRSRGLDDVRRAAPVFDGTPFQSNLIYADADGHIAHFALGSLPRRERTLGCLPALGWRGEGRWQGMESLGSVPWRVDPAEGAVWTANERTGVAERPPGDAGQPFGEHDYRARRFRSVLVGRSDHGPADFARLQVDDLDLAAVQNLGILRDALAGWDAGDRVAARACDLLLAWDGRAAADSAAAAVYYTLFFAEWLPALFPEESCPGLARHWRLATWGGEAVLRAPRSPWFPDPAAKTAALREAASRTVARLRRLAGDQPDAWRWGELHQVRFAHALAFAPRFASGALPPRPLGGSAFTVNQQRFASATPPFGAVVGAGVRMVTDLGDPHHLHLVLSTGQSGDPESPHFADQLPAWAAGEVVKVPLDRERIDVASELVLAPSGPDA